MVLSLLAEMVPTCAISSRSRVGLDNDLSSLMTFCTALSIPRLPVSLDLVLIDPLAIHFLPALLGHSASGKETLHRQIRAMILLVAYDIAVSLGSVV
jgi:hypothetical protein